MAEQVRKTKAKQEVKTEQVEEHEPAKVDAEKLKEELDDLLESIDEALGDNLELAQEFVNSFIQKGGE